MGQYLALSDLLANYVIGGWVITLLPIGAVGLFKLPFFEMRNRCKSYLLELYKASLGCHFSYVNRSCRPDSAKCATVHGFYSCGTACAATRLTMYQTN